MNTRTRAILLLSVGAISVSVALAAGLRLRSTPRTDVLDECADRPPVRRGDYQVLVMDHPETWRLSPPVGSGTYVFVVLAKCYVGMAQINISGDDVPGEVPDESTMPLRPDGDEVAVLRWTARDIWLQVPAGLEDTSVAVFHAGQQFYWGKVRSWVDCHDPSEFCVLGN